MAIWFNMEHTEIATANIPASAKSVIFGMNIIMSHWQNSVTTVPNVL